MKGWKTVTRGLVLIWVMLAVMVPGNTVVTASSTTAKATRVTSEKQFINAIYKGLMAKKETFIISYKGDWHDLYQNNLEDIFDKVCAINKKSTSSDCDYMRENISQYYLQIVKSGNISNFTFTIVYRETKKETQKVNKKVKSALEALDLEDASRYRKVKKIHDYIVNKLTYDSSYTYYTAYNALFDKTAVCQGYALLFYKMATDAGVPCRIVTSQTHAWNIVKMGDKWYHVDTTWDDPVSEKPVLRYTYFLKGSDSVTRGHSLSARFRTTEFRKKYPISQEDYTK